MNGDRADRISEGRFQIRLDNPSLRVQSWSEAGQSKRCNTMAWESRNGGGQYYTRSRRVDGRVVREYIGSDALADAIAGADELERQRRKVAADAQRQERARLDAIDAQFARLDSLADLIVRASLVVAGYHQHHRGDWRKRRGTNTDESDADQFEDGNSQRDATLAE